MANVYESKEKWRSCGRLKWLDENFEKTALCVLLAVLVIVSSANVLLRYAFNWSLVWGEEVCRFCLIFSGFISIAYWVKRESGIRVDAFVKILPKPAQRVVDLIALAVTTAFFIVVLVGAIQLVRATSASAQMNPALHIPAYVVYLAPLGGFALCLIRLVQVWISKFRRTKRGDEEGEQA